MHNQKGILTTSLRELTVHRPNDAHEHKTRSVTLVRYGLAILLTLFLFREAVYMTTTVYPNWLFLVLFASVIVLLLPYQRWTHRENPSQR